ncbi:uncharacterized protein N7525_011122 [Penicillium rubens]|uniref:uncharacterized protein n=1 Tax=Penicillium rubens TaxID=1108849 RepID=UPI002A5A9047|nr:uncharacterized protein N7525_011122 [Penicillium rubens]KAJ5821838.1 hypothetical protein N7525_011122 [Penicillium rubens]
MDPLSDILIRGSNGNKLTTTTYKFKRENQSGNDIKVDKEIGPSSLKIATSIGPGLTYFEKSKSG